MLIYWFCSRKRASRSFEVSAGGGQATSQDELFSGRGSNAIPNLLKGF